MTIEVKRVLVCSPCMITGGPELLHQLVDTLCSIGVDARIVYFPFNAQHQCPEPYRIYNAPQGRFNDDPESLIIVPETATRILGRIKAAKGAVWWLSVDNYFGPQDRGFLLDTLAKYKSLFRHRRPMYALRQYMHFAQSYYALEFLSKVGIQAALLTDYLGSNHLSPRSIIEKRDIVVYNPKKGLSRTIKLQRANPDIKFVPIQHMTPAQVASLLESAKVFIDFGAHPGKDRLPREAAMANCCVITGRRGSAANTIDVPIPQPYKLNDKNSGYVEEFRHLIKSIFENYPAHLSRFEEYRQIIGGERAAFFQQVNALFKTV